MDSLAKHIHALIHSARFGGRTIPTDERTLVLYDCGYWTDEHCHLVKDRFPQCDIVFQTCHGSLSGFIVVFRLHSDRRALLWAALTLACLVLMALTGRQMLLLAPPPTPAGP